MINLHCGSRINPKEKAFWANFCKMSVFNSYFRQFFFLSFLFFFVESLFERTLLRMNHHRTRNCVTHPAGILLDWKKDFRGSKKRDNVCKMKIKKPSGLGTFFHIITAGPRLSGCPEKTSQLIEILIIEFKYHPGIAMMY